MAEDKQLVRFGVIEADTIPILGLLNISAFFRAHYEKVEDPSAKRKHPNDYRKRKHGQAMIDYTARVCKTDADGVYQAKTGGTTFVVGLRLSS